MIENVSSMSTNGGLRSFWGIPHLLGLNSRKADEPMDLVMFTHPHSVECKAMQPGIEKVEKEKDKKILKLKITNQRNYELFQLISLNQTDENSLPLFYDRRTGNRIIGPTTYSNLIKWVEGDRRVSRRAPPRVINKEEYSRFLFEKQMENEKKKQKMDKLSRVSRESSLEHQLSSVDFHHRTGFKARIEKQLSLKKQTIPVKVSLFLISKLFKYDPY
jgi:hypothetical protein